MLHALDTSVLGLDPSREHRINSNSFQQNAITTIHGYQYVVYYTDHPKATKPNACMVNLARRKVVASDNVSGKWEVLSFEDYEQVHDDGHDVISVGVCRGDGTVHLAFDSHCTELKFRMSRHRDEEHFEDGVWDTSIFTETRDYLPGVPRNKVLEEVTYPAFVNVDDDLLFTHRVGEAGLGSDVLYRYSAKTHKYTYLGQHLTGIDNSPYINGLDYRQSRLHMSWCYRNFVQFDHSTNAHKQQAGPNSLENNYDLNYAYSEDVGKTWKNSKGDVIAVLGEETRTSPGNTILPTSDVQVFDIPMNSGILNQEAQAVDSDGGFWVLNRENTSGELQWIVYHRDPKGQWKKHTVPSEIKLTPKGARASICVDSKNNAYLILPGHLDASLSILKAQKGNEGIDFERVWREDGFDGEPLVDIQRLEESDVLSIFTRTDVKGNGRREVVVLDFELKE